MDTITRRSSSNGNFDENKIICQLSLPPIFLRHSVQLNATLFHIFISVLSKTHLNMFLSSQYDESHLQASSTHILSSQLP